MWFSLLTVCPLSFHSIPSFFFLLCFLKSFSSLTSVHTNGHSLSQEYTGDNPYDLFLEEREAQLKVAAKEKRQQQLAVPGIINPHDRPDEMQE